MFNQSAMLEKQGGLAELKARLWFLFLALVVYRIGTHIPVPGVNPDQIAALFEEGQGTILDMVNMFSGGALERVSIFALGIMPYISASIIMQLMSHASPQLAQLRKEGDAGRRKITQYTRYLTVMLAAIQGFTMTYGLLVGQGAVLVTGVGFYFVAVISMVTGSVFLMWLGEQINERGIGNGISMLIFASIVSGLFSAMGQTAEQVRLGQMSFLVMLGIGITAIAVVYFIVFVERGQRRITINYAKRQQGRKVFAAQTSHLPLKINMSGVIPAIFASSILLFLASLPQWLSQSEELSWLQAVGSLLSPNQPLYILLFVILIVFFCFFYTALVFDPGEMADNLKRSGAFIPGIRPGEQSARYIDKVMTRLTMFGSGYIALVCVFPLFLNRWLSVSLSLGGTALLIVVVVVMDFMSQVQSHLVSQQYEKLMKKSKLKNFGSRA